MRRLTLAASFVVAAAVPVVAQVPVNVTPGPLPTDQAVYGHQYFDTPIPALRDAKVWPLPVDERLAAERNRRREQDCLRAVGDKKLCKCIREKSPAIATYADYSTVVTHSKEQLRYEQLDKDTKAYVDQLLSVRAACHPQSQATK